ncbi:MAG: hypothetical protein CMA64_10200 [Euryarchaeota archaeon]|nr:hypothetical protein [Euryarchaeota archaeon]
MNTLFIKRFAINIGIVLASMAGIMILYTGGEYFFSNGAYGIMAGLVAYLLFWIVDMSYFQAKSEYYDKQYDEISKKHGIK